MTLYEKFKAGEMELLEYHIKAENILMDAIDETLKENRGYTYYYLEKELKATCDLTLITETNGARKSVEETLKCFRGKIDRDNLNMVLLSNVMDENDFITLYSTLYTSIENNGNKRIINREESNTICSIITDSSFVLKCQSVVGTLRNNNEDFAVTIVSPLNDNIKLLLVCDGIGGYDGGELASKFVAKKIITWFNKYNFNNKNLTDVDNEFKKIVLNLHLELQKLLIGAGTTLTAAIVGEKETIIANIGDSRTYSIKNRKLTQITEDDSIVWKKYYKKEDDFNKDDLRFLVGNNCIDDCLGCAGSGIVNTTIINNDLYDGLLLVSDGVTDILSDKTIIDLYFNSKNEEYIDKILYESCYGPSQSIGLEDDDDWFFQKTTPGKDNASVALYLKR